MSRQLDYDCLDKIFEYLEEDKTTLHSCLLVNRLWREVSVGILWRNIWSFKYSNRVDVISQILSTLIACLPNGSKDLLFKNGIFIETPTYKPPLFNYASYCKVLSVHKIDQMIEYVLENHHIANSSKYLLLQEILKMFMMNQIKSLKSLDYYYSGGNPKRDYYIHFTGFPGAKEYLRNLSELYCSSNIYFKFFHEISQICCNIRTLTIRFKDIISNGLENLIFSQKKLKHLKLIQDPDGMCWSEIIPSLTNHSIKLTKLYLCSYSVNVPLSFIGKYFKTLQELVLSFKSEEAFLDNFDQLQYVTFPRLKVLKFLDECPRFEVLTNFLETNGKNLEELYVANNDNSLNLDIAKFCLNLKSLYTIFKEDEVETLRAILSNCQYLESIGVWCDGEYLNEKEFLENLAKYSSKYFNELRICYVYDGPSEIFPEELEEFFINWKNRIPRKPLSFIIKGCCVKSFENKKENLDVIEKYKRLGIIKKFEIEKFSEE
ncbi:hypothetical protein RclHR1_03740002 [Rhizophagus clarus]|uniref:F-box domain-containing protein n=1 Tax=Rhizophagus clarus TaxID=94130 RepID=A0A2Z6RC65_9GLOM|nr:hypothetical protein RclHR1_03740002 [Rhizophagus clarus]GES82848.1 hypothetical protein GLOIN_2v1784405 [Rhizophagus clarus]